MNINRKLFPFVFVFSIFYLSASYGKCEDFILFNDLINVVVEDESDSLENYEDTFQYYEDPEESYEECEEEVPDIILNIVKDYYAEEVVPQNLPFDVMSYITGLYEQQNDFSENTGSYLSTLSTNFRMPINGVYTSFYGYRPKFGRFHKGIDISLQVGDTVRSVLPGVVVKVKNDPKGYGNYVVVRHEGDLETLYAHLTRGLVGIGQRLRAGEAIGLGGVTGNSTGPHLHFETRLRGEAIDPLYYLPKRSVRKR